MSIFDKLFKKDAPLQPPKQPANVQQQENRLSETQVSPPATVKTESNSVISAEQCLKEAQSKIPNDRIAYFFSIRDEMESSWTLHQKAYLCFLTAAAVKAGAANPQYRESNLKLAFYAAQLYYEPDNDSAGWQEFIRYGFNPSKENATRLHEAYPLPKSIAEAKNYTAVLIRNEEKSNPVQTSAPSAKNIRHIVCLCYDTHYINLLKPQMQNFIINAEQNRGNTITPTSRITFDSFYDNSSLEKPDMIRQKLEQIYCQVYHQAAMYELADKTIAREVQQMDGHSLVKYFVLYE